MGSGEFAGMWSVDHVLGSPWKDGEELPLVTGLCQGRSDGAVDQLLILSKFRGVGGRKVT